MIHSFCLSVLINADVNEVPTTKYQTKALIFYLICFVSLQMSTLTCLHISKGHHAVWADVALAVVQIRPKQALSTKLAIKKRNKDPLFL